ncbi:hypothetical protein [Methylomagnum sp.]
MQTLTFDCEIGTSRDLVLRLPTTVKPGPHRFALVIDPDEGEAEIMSPAPLNAPPRTALWQRLEAVRAEAKDHDEVPAPLPWEAILDEVQRRRGEAP